VPKSRSRKHAAQEDAIEYLVEGECEADLDLCPDEPAPDCDGAVGDGRARFQLRAHRKGSARDRMRWNLRGVDSSVPDFGDPTSDTDYQLCVYDVGDGQVSLLMDPGARAGAGWREGRSGFKFRAGRDGRGDGLGRVLLKARRGARGSVAAQGRGSALGLPDLPLPDDAEVRVQLHNSDGQCWDSVLPEVRRNTATRYDARGD
jgi:hypothetical protein